MGPRIISKRLLEHLGLRLREYSKAMLLAIRAPVLGSSYTVQAERGHEGRTLRMVAGFPSVPVESGLA